MRVRYALLTSAYLAALGCQSARTVQQPIESTPICRVVQQEWPEPQQTVESTAVVAERDLAYGPDGESTGRVSGRTVRRPTVVESESPRFPKPPLAARTIGRSVAASRDAHESDGTPDGKVVAASLSAEDAAPVPEVSSTTVPQVEQPADRYPITLSTALYLAGSSNLQVALAQERVREAYARLDGAKVLWVPNISGGVGFNDHAGQLQNIEGQILEINRQSLFVGGGAGFGNSPLAGGANPPPRMMIDLSPVDILFEPLSARQRANRASHDASVAFNDTQLNVSYVYLELVRAQARVAIARESLANIETLQRITSDFARTGLGLEADDQRARADAADRQRELLVAEEEVRVYSTELARLLRLDPSVTLFALETQPLPIELISADVSLESLMTQGLRSRPEISREYAHVAATDSRISQERLRPWVPNLHVGVGGGTFGGGRNDNFGDFSGRYDLDALAVWEVRNLGFGNRALVRERESEYRQACLEYQSARDRVQQEVAAAYHQARLRREQIGFAEQQVAAAANAVPLNFNGIRGRELRPIEAQQSIAALALARNRYVNSVVDYNRAQLALWRAIGHPPGSASEVESTVQAIPAAEAMN
ncbi:MAG: TolC family protein [Planctomycetaceae bacterium]|nr:TolC family protein [Planctomycetaceae bacterium]